jgi:hypothetical protein
VGNPFREKTGPHITHASRLEQTSLETMPTLGEEAGGSGEAAPEGAVCLDNLPQPAVAFCCVYVGSSDGPLLPLRRPIRNDKDGHLQPMMSADSYPCH